MVEFFPSRETVVMVGDFTVRWYGLLYILAFWLGWFLLPRIGKQLGLSREQWNVVAAATVVGVVVGGRLGYVMLYEPGYFVRHLSEIFSSYSGGMSFHGGFIGVGLALWWAARKMKLSFPALVDVMVVPVAFGLAFGRVGNFINQELYVGYWALGVTVANLGLGILCWCFLVEKKLPLGTTTAVFLIGCSVIRFLNEFVRIDEWQHIFGLTYGQLLTIPIFLVGLWLVLANSRRLKGYGSEGQRRS